MLDIGSIDHNTDTGYSPQLNQLQYSLTSLLTIPIVISIHNQTHLSILIVFHINRRHLFARNMVSVGRWDTWLILLHIVNSWRV